MIVVKFDYALIDSHEELSEITLEWRDVDVFVPAKTRCFGRKLVEEEQYILSGSYASFFQTLGLKYAVTFS